MLTLSAVTAVDGVAFVPWPVPALLRTMTQTPTLTSDLVAPTSAVNRVAAVHVTAVWLVALCT
jgi:hypothetical protein